MSLSGVHIAFGYCNLGYANGDSHVALPYQVTASQTMAAPGKTTISAPAANSPTELPLLLSMLSISASAAIYYATGSNPDAVNGPRRYYDPGFGREDILVAAGDLVAWTWA